MSDPRIPRSMSATVAARGARAAEPAPTAPVGLAGHPALRIAAVAVGGALGTLVRYWLGRVIVAGPASFPWATFVANLLGAAAIGIVVTLATERLPHRPHLRPFLGVGFCGGLTTFSTLMVQTVQLGRHGHAGLAVADVVGSVAAGLVVAALAVATTRRAIGVRARPTHLVDPDTLARLDDEVGA